jgi:regulator of RNase E activity RraA
VVTTAFRTPFDLLAQLGVAHVTDACRALGVVYELADERMRQIVPGTRLAGTALTLRLHLARGAPPYTEGAIQQFEHAAEIDHPVLVVRNDVPGFDTLGSFDARLARAAGYQGYVVDGPVRDTDALAKLRFPTFATSVRADCIRLTDLPEGVGIGFDFASSIEVAGMSETCGMIVVADGDGVMAFAADRLTEVVDAAAALANREARLMAMLDGGASVRDVLRAYGRDGD